MGTVILPNRDNVYTVIVTYNPNFISLCENLRVIEKITTNIIIVDNGTKDCENFYKIQSRFIDIIYLNENKGIAFGLNRGIELALRKGANYILTLDQDSVPVCNILELYAQAYDSIDDIGLIGTNYSDSNLKTYHKVVFKEKLTIITSGTLHPRYIYNKIGLYNEDLFIDSVDFDFTIRVKNAGFKTLRSEQILLKHSLGTPIKRFGFYSSNHLPWRRYFMGRNHVYISKRYFFSNPWWILSKNIHFVDSIVRMMIVEHNRYEKLKCLIKGIYDGFHY